jgi:hypothetical protein
VASAVRLQAACGEPDGVGVYRDLNGGVGGVVVWPAGAEAERVGEGLVPGAGGELAQALPLARDPGAVAQGLVDGAGGVADGGFHLLLLVVAQLGEVAALRAEDLGERADVELGGGGAGGRAGPEPVAAADGQVRRQVAGDGPGDAAAGCAVAAGRAQHLPEPVGVAQVVAGVVPVEPGDPGQRLACGGRETFLLVLFAAAGVEDDRGRVVQGAGELEEFEVVGVSEPADVVQVVLAGDGHALAASYQALEQACRQREATFAAVMADRADWEAATRAQRPLAVAADAELRRRHPGQHFTPLRSAEPPPATGAQRDGLTLTPGGQPGELDQWITDLAAGHRAFADRLADRQSQTIPSQDPDYGALGPAFPAWTGPGREPILQPPRPEIPPSLQILQRAMDRDADWEAAD